VANTGKTSDGSDRRGPNGTPRRQTPISESRVDSTLAAMIVGIILLSVVVMILNAIGSASGWWTQATADLYYTVVLLPFVALPVGIVLLIVVAIRIAIRRRRQAKER